MSIFVRCIAWFLKTQGFDYTNGAFFVTINAHGAIPLFGYLRDDKIHPNEFGNILEAEWLKTGELRPNVELDVYQIMPNHFHAILFLYNELNTRDEFHFNKELDKISEFKGQSGTLGAIIGSFKGAVTRRVNADRNTPNLPVWQRNYYERIIRNYDEVERIRNYIRNNTIR